MWWANKHGIIAFLKSLYRLILNLNNNLLKQKTFLYVLKISIISCYIWFNLYFSSEPVYDPAAPVQFPPEHSQQPTYPPAQYYPMNAQAQPQPQPQYVPPNAQYQPQYTPQNVQPQFIPSKTQNQVQPQFYNPNGQPQYYQQTNYSQPQFVPLNNQPVVYEGIPVQVSYIN